MGVSKTYAAIRADTRLTPAEQEAKIQRLRDYANAHQRALRAELRALREKHPNAPKKVLERERHALRMKAKRERRDARRERKNARQRARRAEEKARAARAARGESDADAASEVTVPISTADPRLAARIDTPEEIAARAARNAARVARERVDLLSVKPPKGDEEVALAGALVTVRRLGQQREAVRMRLAEIRSELGLGRLDARSAESESARLEQLERDLSERLAIAREAAGLPREIRAEMGLTESAAQRAQRDRARKNAARNAARRREESAK